MVQESVAEPCPDVVKKLSPDESFETVASIDAYLFVDRGDGYRLDVHQMLNPDVIGSALMRIKYALQTRDVELFYAGLAPQLTAKYPKETLSEKLAGDPDLNALYAALAASSLDDMQCEKLDKGARCFASGMTVSLELVDHNWKLAGFE